MSVTIGESKVFRGSSLESVLAQVRDALGPDAVVVRQREGFVGGIAGFFAKKCVEVEAMPGWPVADEDTVLALPAREAMSHYGAADDVDDRLPAPANDFMEALLDRAAAFDELFVPTDPVGLLPARESADRPAPDSRREREPDFGQLVERAVAAAEVPAEPLAPALGPTAQSPELAPAVIASGLRDELLDTQAGVRTSLAQSGMSGAAIEAVMERVRGHLHPLAPTASTRGLARLAIRSALQAPVGWEGRRLIAFAGLDGAPLARTVAAIAAAHAEAGARVAVIALGGGRPAARLAAHLGDSEVDVLLARDLRDVEPAIADASSADLVLALSSPISSADDATGVACAAPLVALGPDELHLVVSADTRPDRMHRALALLDGFLTVDYLLPCGAAVTDELGAAVGVALERRLALRWVASTGASVRAHPADPVVLAEAVLP